MEDRPSIKRVVNVGKMRFQSKSNAATQSNNISDLHRLNSIKSISFYDTMNKAPENVQLTTYTLRQTSELDLDEKFTLEKSNPIFLQDHEELKNERNSLEMPSKEADNAKVLKIDCEFKPITKPALDEITKKGETPLIKPSYSSKSSFSSFSKENEEVKTNSSSNGQISMVKKNNENSSDNEAKSVHSNGSIKSVIGAFSPVEEDKLSIHSNGSFRSYETIYDNENSIKEKKHATLFHKPKIKLSKGSIKSYEEIKSTLNLDDQERLSSIAKSIGFSNGSIRSFDDITLQDDSSSLATVYNQNELENNSQNIFPLVAVSEADVFEFNENKSDDDDDDMMSLYNSEFDFFNQNLNSLNIRERKTSDISQEAKNLKSEMNNQFQVFEIKSVDILYNLIAVSLYQKYWIAGFKNATPNLFKKIHFGDEILSINDYFLNDLDKESFMLLAKNSVRPLITVKIRRLPFARVILITGISKKSKEINLNKELKLIQKASEVIFDLFGIRFKNNTAKIEKIQEDGLFYKNGLKYDSNKVEFDISTSRNNANTIKIDEKDRLTKWVITEINGDNLNYRCSAEEILTRLTASEMASVVVHPYDLVKGLYKEINKLI